MMYLLSESSQPHDLSDDPSCDAGDLGHIKWLGLNRFEEGHWNVTDACVPVTPLDLREEHGSLTLWVPLSMAELLIIV